MGVCGVQQHIDLQSSSYIIEATVKEKRSRTYSVDDDDYSTTKEVIIESPTKVSLNNHHSKNSLANHNAESVPLNSGENTTDVERHGENVITVKEDQNPFDRKVSRFV